MTQSRNLAVRLRILSGLVLLAFVLTHLLNHSLGVLSLDAMEAGRLVFLAAWRHPAGTALLTLALLLHLVLGWAKVWRLPSWRMPAWELIQIASGLLIPIGLLPHMTGTLIANLLFGIEDTYAFVLLALWSPWGVSNAVTLLLAWTHGSLGLHFWLRFRPTYAKWKSWFLGAAVLVPALALLGFWSGLREVQVLAADPAWLAAQAEAGHWPDEAMRAEFTMILIQVMAGTALVNLALLGSGMAVARWKHYSRTIQVRYSNGACAALPLGGTVLQASRMAGIPHASVCGGRGRCSTCRVRVGAGLDLLPPPGIDERRVLSRVGAPPQVRLACQIRPTHPLHVTPLCPPYFEPGRVFSQSSHGHGREMDVTILFSDLRGFTKLTEQKLAYDVVFLLNLYFRAMGEVIDEQRGHLVQVFGDGMMALFGINEDPVTGARRALLAAKAMAERLDTFNLDRPIELNEPLRMGIGVHSGAAIVGEMGYRGATILTAVGEAVNTAARLQEATKTFTCQMVVSERVGQLSGVDLSPYPKHELEVRGTSHSLPVHAVPDGRDLRAIPAPGFLAAGPGAGPVPVRSAT